MPPSLPKTRPDCLRCRRPQSACFCAQLPQLYPCSKVVLLQHPRERKVAIGTARMTHLALPESMLLEGIAFDAHPQLQDILNSDDVALLFPGPTARPASDWSEKPPKTLVVVDGTWWQAKKLLTANPRLAALPRLGLDPDKPGNYRIRKEPTDKHLSTVEAVALTLGILENAPQDYAQMLRPFDFLVEQQIEAQRNHLPRRRKSAGPWRANLHELAPLLSAPERAVVVTAEANSHPRKERDASAPELLHLVAWRPFDGQRFEAVLRPRRRLGSLLPERLGISEETLVCGEAASEFGERWRAFLKADDVLCLWTRFTERLLTQEEFACGQVVELRDLASRALRGPTGGLSAAVTRLRPTDSVTSLHDATAPTTAHPQRAMRHLARLVAVYEALLSQANDEATRLSVTETNKENLV